MTPAFFTERVGAQAIIAVNNDRRPDFASNPFNGPAPRDLRARRSRYVQRTNGQMTSGASSNSIRRRLFSYQSSIGMQHQVSPTTGVQADYVFTGVRDEITRNVNFTYNPATGVNYPNTTARICSIRSSAT